LHFILDRALKTQATSSAIDIFSKPYLIGDPNITHSFRDASAVSSISCRSCNRKRSQSVEEAIALGIKQTV
ncbi:hypothetical protein QUA40_07810, partial [Microcoleus sp. Pol11C3]|uniref:hypothetical protein n=1 Tax=Microcoleus sp. Pol11C3 TaxID=3055390 RepID=UPI002FCEE28B